MNQKRFWWACEIREKHSRKPNIIPHTRTLLFGRLSTASHRPTPSWTRISHSACSKGDDLYKRCFSFVLFIFLKWIKKIRTNMEHTQAQDRRFLKHSHRHRETYKMHHTQMAPMVRWQMINDHHTHAHTYCMHTWLRLGLGVLSSDTSSCSTSEHCWWSGTFARYEVNAYRTNTRAWTTKQNKNFN